MFGIGLPELIIILVIALIFVGPGKLPEVGKAIGKGIRNFKNAVEGPEEEEKPSPPAKTEPEPQQKAEAPISPYEEEETDSDKPA